MDFRKIEANDVRLENVTVPGWLLNCQEDLVQTNISILDGKIAVEGGKPVNMNRALLIPAFVDMHTHLDKGHIWGRAPNPDGRFESALEVVTVDRQRNWSALDLQARMTFALRCAYAYGTQSIRTHLDSIPPQDQISWPLFSELRQEWAGKIDLQGVCLIGVDAIDFDRSFSQTADLVARSGGVLGMVAYPIPDFRDRLRTFLAMAQERQLAVDFHADETLDSEAECLRIIAETASEMRFENSIVVGHCCSLSMQESTRALNTLDKVARAGIHIVSLPMCNLYLQDRQAGVTPRSRGITLVHEMKNRGISVSFASDNTRDPFFAYGDLDMLEVMREAIRLGHLDHSDRDWSRAFLTNPAAACGFEEPSLEVGSAADLLLFNARNWNELFSRPQSDRIVLRAGRQIERVLPNYCELDEQMRTP
ncbi:MAG: cytosine deaminase [Aestuariivita sp.]|nr:cytosine deaminase [Aestuariivita sp.]MCY4203383.1 cytosine deaminase [Aestuariivita sp.]